MQGILDAGENRESRGVTSENRIVACAFKNPRNYNCYPQYKGEMP